MSESVNTTISGSQLKLLFSDLNFINSIFYSKVVYGPSESLNKIRDHYNVDPSMDGNNVSDIIAIRDHIYNICTDKSWINAFTITAPHTHWPDKKAVIYQYEPNKNIYVIGPFDTINSSRYIPVSFVFNEGLPLPYEWAHESVAIDEREWELCYNLICQLNAKLENNIPLGIAIDFRFRSSLFDTSQPSLEVPIEDDKEGFNPEFSYIVNSPGIIQRNESSATEQVSWHPISELSYQFSEEELVLLNQLRSNLSALDDPYSQERLIGELQAGLQQNRI